MDILIENVSIVGPDGITPGMDIHIREGVVAAVGAGLASSADKTIDGTGLHAFPGFCDMHCHLRDPGLTHKEDIVTGTRSAAAGGYTAVCCMPNTKPVVDDPKTVKYILEKARAGASANVYPVACITRGMKGKRLTDFEALLSSGAVAFSDDGLPVQDPEMIVAAMEQAKELDALLMLHEEDLKHRGEGVAHDGEHARQAGLPGISRAVEDVMTARDLYYALKFGGRVHFCHVSTRGSVDLIRHAKAAGARVTCETGPHYFSLTDAEILSGHPNAKVNPPLREEADRQAILEGIADGTIDAIATDHAPHSKKEKDQPFGKAPFGLIGFETAFSLAITHLYRPGVAGLPDIARLMSSRPREILRIEGGWVRPGAPADLALCDVDASFIYREQDVVSRSRNSPFLGRELRGRVMYTIREGRITYDR